MIKAADALGGSPGDSLSERERYVIRQIAAGKSVATIAKESGLSVKTISTCRMRILEKLRLADTAALVEYAANHGLAG